jgi:hypothetical protein
MLLKLYPKVHRRYTSLRLDRERAENGPSKQGRLPTLESVGCLPCRTSNPESEPSYCRALSTC